MPPDVTREMQRYRWLIFILLSSSYILVYFHRLCPSVLAVDLMRDLNARGSLTGFLAAAYFYPYALMQLPAGLLSDSWGPRKTITLFFIVAFIGSIILGLSPSVSWAIIGRALIGTGVAMLFVPTLKILAEWFFQREFAYMTGLLMAMGGLGSLIAASPLAWLNNWVGWRNAFLIIGLVTLGLSFLVWTFVRNSPSDKGWPLLKGPEQATGPTIDMRNAVKQVLSCIFFWPVAIWLFFDFAVFFAFGGLWGGPYLMHVYGMSNAEAGRILSMMAIGLVFGGPFLSWLSDKVFNGRKPVIILTSFGLVILTALLTFCTASIPGWGLYALYFMLTVCSSAVIVVGITMNKELFPIGIAGTASGMVNLFPFIGGAVFQPFLGYLLELGGQKDGIYSVAAYQLAFSALFICAVIALVAALCTRETLIIKPEG